MLRTDLQQDLDGRLVVGRPGKLLSVSFEGTRLTYVRAEKTTPRGHHHTPNPLV